MSASYLIDVDDDGPTLTYVDAHDALVAYDALARCCGRERVSAYVSNDAPRDLYEMAGLVYDDWIELDRAALYSASVDWTDCVDD